MSTRDSDSSKISASLFTAILVSKALATSGGTWISSKMRSACAQSHTISPSAEVQTARRFAHRHAAQPLALGLLLLLRFLLLFARSRTSLCRCSECLPHSELAFGRRFDGIHQLLLPLRLPLEQGLDVCVEATLAAVHHVQHALAQLLVLLPLFARRGEAAALR